MAIADIVTYGFGSYSNVNKIPTHGYHIGSATRPDGLDYHVADNRPHYHVADNRPHYEVS
jgi:hypothetical protein